MALDLSDPELVAAVARVRSDVDPATYCVFGYEGKAKIICKNIGEGSCYAAMGEMNDSEVSYALLRVTGTRDQESKTVKFIFVMYVGPNVGGMARGRAGGHKPSIMQLIGQSHVSVQADDLDDITEEKLVDKLKKASGANYDLGSNASGYETKAGNIGPVVFNAKSHVVDKNNVTAMDLGGRPMVAPPTEGKKNVVVRDEAARAPGGSSSTVAARKEFERLADFGDKVVVLFTSMTRDQLATVATRKIITQLDGLGAPYVQLDGMAPENKDLRKELWTMADAKPGTYPIVYVGSTGFVCKADEAEVLAALEALVGHLEACTGSLVAASLESLISRLERVAGQPPPPATGGKAPATVAGLEAATAQLGELVLRLEQVAVA